MSATKQDLRNMHSMIINKFIKDLHDTLKSGDCFNYFARKMQKSIQEEVYDRYNPTEYERRGEKGGLLDKKNYDYDVSISGKGIYIFMKNLTKGVGMAYQIDEGIVKGVDFYDWELSKAYMMQEQGGFPRDFYTYMEILVEDDKELQRILEKSMKQKGWTTK